MHAIKVESGIPEIPAAMGRPLSYPFDEMKVGDSLFIPAPVDTRRVQQTISTRAISYGNRRGWKFSTRRSREGGCEGIRVWRTA